MQKIRDIQKHLLCHGRVPLDDNGDMVVSWNYSGFSLRFCGSQIAIYIGAYPAEPSPYVAVIVDGYVHKCAVTGEQTVLSFPVKQGEHTVSFRQVAAQSGTPPILVQAVEIDGKFLTPPAPQKRQIEFLGDSITCGYGVLSAPGAPYCTNEEYVLENYAVRTATALQAEARLESITGQGVVKACNGQIGTTIGTIFRSAVRQQPTFPQWDFADGFCPDAVVIHAGTNDVGGGTTEQEMIQGATALIRDVREHYPNAKIVWFYGLMNGNFVKPLEQCIADIRKTDKNVWFLPTARITNEAKEVGGNGHPGILGHRRAAQELTALLREILKW